MSRNSSTEKGIASVLLLVLLLAGLGLGVYLAGRQTFFKPRASLEGTRIQIFGPSVNNDTATSRNVRLRLIYEPMPLPSPTTVSIPTPNLATRSCSSMNVQPSFFIAPYSPRGVNADSDVANCFLRSDTPTGVGTDPSCQEGGNSGPRTKLRQALMNGSLVYRDIKNTSSSVNASDATSRMFLRVDNNCWQGAKAVVYGRSCDSWGPLVPTQAEVNSLISDLNNGKVYVPGVCGEPIPSSSPQPSQTPQVAYPSHFKIANDSTSVSVAPELPFTTNSLEMDWFLADGANGVRTIYAQFKIDGIWGSPISSNINLQIPTVSPVPSATASQSPTPVPSPIPSPSPTASNNPVSCYFGMYIKFADIASNGPQEKFVRLTFKLPGSNEIFLGFDTSIPASLDTVYFQNPNRNIYRVALGNFQCGTFDVYVNSDGYQEKRFPGILVDDNQSNDFETYIIHGPLIPLATSPSPTPSLSPQPSVTPTPVTPVNGDLNGDGTVTLSDVSLYIARNGVDLDSNGVIDYLDRRIMVETWLHGGRRR